MRTSFTGMTKKVAVGLRFHHSIIDNIGERPIKTGRILIADDEYLIRWSLTQALTHEGYEVVAVENGKKAIESARTEIFDFIITDLIMPEMDGWEVLEFVRKIPTPPLVIMITAHGKEGTEKIAREKGAWAYVEKPFIIDKIRNLLAMVRTNSSENNLN
jgi:CheY-like chemotaxis protein